MVISKLKYMICPVRDKMSVENARCPSNPVPSGTECGDSYIAYLTARGKLVAVNFSTDILSRRDRKTGLSQKSRFVIARNEAIPACIGDCFVVPPRNDGGIRLLRAPSGTENSLHVIYFTLLK
ncbi:MAG: hypothetical protein LBJ47_02380 [Tannerella sp.]|nr:hypothetical protein [Tannerella sp.]